MDFYLKYLKQCSEISKYSSTSLCKILLSWFPGGDQDIYSKNLSKKVKKQVVTKKPKQHYSQFYLTAKDALPPYVKWSFLSWIDSIFGFDTKNIEHMDILEFLTFIIIGDLFSIVLRYCDDLDKSLLTLIVNNTIEIFTDLSTRQYGIWVNNPMIFDQWSYVIRRLSLINPIVTSDIFKTRMKQLPDPEILIFLKVFRYFQVDLSKEKIDGFKEVFNHYISLISTYKKNQVIKEALLENLDLLFRQVDFVTQPEILQFEKQFLDLIKDVKEWEKKCSGSFKRFILFFLSTYTTHYTWQNFDKIIDESVQKLLKNYRKTTNIGGAIESITRLLEDKISMDPRLFLANTLNYLEKNDEFSSIVYYEPLREIPAFTLDESKETQQKDYNGFLLKKKYLTKIKEVCSLVHNDLFLGKSKPVISSKEPVEEVIFFYTNYLVRICAINLELGLKTLSQLLSEKNKTWELFLISLHVVNRIVYGKDSQNSELKAIHQNYKLVQEFLKSNSSNFINIMKLCEDLVGSNSVGITPTPFSVYSYKMKNQPLEDSSEGGNEDQEITSESPIHTDVSFVKSQNTSDVSSEGGSENEEKEDDDLSGKTLSFTGQTNDEILAQKKKDEKLVQKRLANSVRSKKSNKLQYLLYLELLKLLPYLAIDSLIKTKELKSFIGTKLVHNDSLVARNCSNSLQQYIFEQKDETIRESIISGIISMLEDTQYHEVSCVITLLDNLNLMINLWTESIKEDQKNLKNLQKEEIVSYMGKYWNEKDLWINKLESIILIHLCFYEKKLRSSCFALIKTISEFTKSKKIVGYDNYTSRVTLFDILEKKSEYIVQKANFLYIVKNIHGVRNDANIPEEYSSLYEHSQREDSPYLWSFILSELAKVLVEENYVEQNDLTVFSNLKVRIQALQALDQIKHLGFDDPNGIKYTNFLVLRMAISGIKENEGIIENMKNYNTEISLLCQNIFKAFKSEIQWVKNAVIYSSSSVHYLNIGILLKNLNEYIVTQTKPKTKPREVVLQYAATILSTISNTIEFKKSFYARTSSEKDNSILTIQSLNSIFKHFFTFISEISYPKMKTVSHIEKTLIFELEVCSTLYNLASIKTNVLKDESIWSLEDRFNIVSTLQILSGYGEKAQNPNRKPKPLDSKKVPQEHIDNINFALPEKINRISQEAIVLLLKLNPIYKKEDSEIVKQLEWFEKAEARGFNTLSSLLYYHIDQLMDYYISRLYTETEDHLLSAYLIGIHDMLNPLSNYYYAVNSGVVNEIVSQLKDEIKAEKPPKITKYSIQLLHACLWAINHRNVSVHNYAFQLLCVLAENGFDNDLPTDETDKEWEINKRKQESEILKKFTSAMKTYSDYSLSVFVEQISYILSQSHSSMTTALFIEAFSRIDKIAVSDRKLWLLSVLKPWFKYVDLSKENNNFLETLFKITLNLSKQSGFFGDLKNIWQDLALGDWEKSKSNFSTIVKFSKKHCFHAEHRLISKEIILSLYQVKPFETVEEIVMDFEIEICQKDQDNETKQKELLALHKADILFLMDLFCETQIIQPLILNIPIIFNFILTHYDKDPENMKTLLKNILLRATTSPCKISQLLDMKNLTIHFRKDFGKKIISQLTSQGVEDPSIRYGYMTKSILAHDLVNNFVSIMEKHFSPIIVEQIGDYALRNATKVDNTDSLYKMISVYSSILKPLNEAAVQKMVYVLLSTSKMLDENKTKKSKGQIEQEYISLMVLFLSTLRDQCSLLTKQNLNSTFWTAITFLSSPIPEIYTVALEIFELFRKDKDSFKFFSQAYQETLLNYSKNLTPQFQGYLIYLLKGLCMKDTEMTTIQAIIGLNQSDFSSGLDILPERRYLTALTLCLPWIYKEGSNESSFDKVSLVCSSFGEYLKGDLGTSIKNFDLLKSNIDEFIQKICVHIVKDYFPTHSQKCSEILYSLTFGIQENLTYIFKITKNLLESSNSKDYLNYFVPIIRISLGYSKSSFDQVNLLMVSSLKISKERGDIFNVSQSSKILGVQNNPMRAATTNEIESNLNEIFQISLKEVNPVEKSELKDSFDFKGITIYDTTLAPNSKQYLITKPIKDKDTTRIVDITDIKPSQIRMEEEMKNKAEREKKEKEEMERIKTEEYLRQKKEKEDQVKQNQYIVSCLQKFALQWRDKAREIKEEEVEKKELTVLEKILSDSESGDLLIDFAKNVSPTYQKDVLFCQDVLDFIEEKGRTESILQAKDIMERFIKAKGFDLEESIRSNTIIEYGANQSDPKKTIFDSALSQVSQRIEKSVLEKFLNSTPFKNYEAKQRKKTKK